MYQELDPKQINELTLRRRGWLTPDYTLTDSVNTYGQLSYDSISKRNAQITTATTRLRVSFEDFFSRTIIVTDENGAVIGKCSRDLFSRTRKLTLQSGFTAVFYRPDFFSREYIWESDGCGKIMSIKNNFPFTLTTDIRIYPSNTPASVMPLMIFLGEHLIILRRRKRAIH
jgi:hypothetical protein